MKNSFTEFESRKQDHIRLAISPNNEALGLSGLDSIRLIHEAIPELDFAEVNLKTEIFNLALPSPFFISSMTAGHIESINLNQTFAEAAGEKQWLMGVGSQRRELTDPEAHREWQRIRKASPKARLVGNIGISQLITTPIKKIRELADSLDAVAMIVHTNPLQECIQPEGTPQFKGAYAAIEHLCQELQLPVIVKETGCGFSAKTLARLNNLGVSAVDISGLGGTHWGRIEGKRAKNQSVKNVTAETFKNWGIPTVESLMQAKALHPNYLIFASGGVRSGLDAAKLLSLGAAHIGLAKPLLIAALEGIEVLINTMETFEYELKTALFCTGNATIRSLQENQTWQIVK